MIGLVGKGERGILQHSVAFGLGFMDSLGLRVGVMGCTLDYKGRN